MLICSARGRENPAGSRFCNACGADLAAPGTAREERKVVTVVFADLVGFTARAEQMDPEEVRALLAPYHARLRSELELFGGTVEMSAESFTDPKKEHSDPSTPTPVPRWASTCVRPSYPR